LLVGHCNYSSIMQCSQHVKRATVPSTAWQQLLAVLLSDSFNSPTSLQPLQVSYLRTAAA